MGRPAFVALCIALVACGARTATAVGVGDDRDGGSSDASVPCRRWTVAGPPVLVSTAPLASPDDGLGLGDAVAMPDGVLVSWSRIRLFGDEDGFVAVRKLRWDASPASDIQIATPEHVGFSGGLLAVGFGHAALLIEGPTGALVRPLNLDGSAAGPPVAIEARAWSSFVATPSGFEFLRTRSPNLLDVELVQLDATGALVHQSTLMTAAPKQSFGRYGWGRATLRDGTFVVTTRTTAYLDYHVVARHFDSQGSPLGPLQDAATLDIVSDGNFAVPVVPVTGGVLAAWSPMDAHVGEPLVVRPLLADGSPNGDAVVIAPDLTRSFVLAPESSGGALVAWTTLTSVPSPDGEVSLHLRALAPSGVPVGDDLVLPQLVPGKPGGGPRVVTDGSRGMLFFDASPVPQTGKQWRVYALPLACGP